LAQKASSADKVQILSLEAKIRELEGKLERANEDLNSKNHEIECMEKGMEATHEITGREIDTLRKERLNSMEENSHLREIISKKDNEIADLSNPPLPPPPMDDSLQKLPGWVSDDLRPSSMSVVLKIKLWNSIKVLPEKIY
jgi:seryl-tRNA synthetase